MRSTLILSTAMAALLNISGSAPASAAAALTVVKVQLHDPSTADDLKKMEMKLDRDTVPAAACASMPPTNRRGSSTR
jgi:hypothetical protein